jgi:23S rRNA (uracil1939-C5)-methyltransferase
MADTLIKVRIEGIAGGVAGFAQTEGKSVFIEGSAPGDLLLCRITKEHRSWMQAELLEISEPSPVRVQPACKFYGICGGCNVQHINYPAQLAAKTSILVDSYKHIGGGFTPPDPIVISSEQWGYRNRMQFHIMRQRKKKDTEIYWGLKARKSDDIVPVSGCPVADSGIQKILSEKNRLPLPPEKDRFTVYARGGLLLNEGGNSRGSTRVLDKTLVLDAGVFFQSNCSMLEKLIADLREIAAAADLNLPMADLYCGAGTFAAFLGELFPHIDLVEENKTALALARENIAAHASAEFFAQDIEHWAKNRFKRHYGFVVADPPRQGLDTALASRLALEGPPLLAYVSCNPATLARDSKILVEGGYELKELRFYDFYPQTAHIETLALFIRPHPLLST